MSLEQGSSGADVRRLQVLLNDKVIPRPRLRVDGHFGARTLTAVRLVYPGESHKLIARFKGG